MEVKRRYKGVEGSCRRARGCTGLEEEYKGEEGIIGFGIHGSTGQGPRSTVKFNPRMKSILSKVLMSTIR